MAGNKRKYLVPYNFSTKSELALDYALEQSQTDPNCEFYIFYVFEDATRNFRRLDKLNEEYMERMKQVLMEAIERAQAKGIQPNIEHVHRRIAHGKAAHEILAVADGIVPDYIVMGAPSSSAFRKLVFNAPCTLVLVKQRGQ